MKINLFKTTDLPIVTTLSLYYPIKAVDQVGPNKLLFSFDKTPELEKTIEDYWSGRLLIEPQSLLNQLKVMKSRIHGSN